MLPEGQQPYTPTRAEWLAVILNSTNIVSNPATHGGLSVVYMPDSKSDTIRIIFKYPKEKLSEDQVHGLIDLQKKLVLKEAKFYGWDSWLKIEVEVVVDEINTFS